MTVFSITAPAAGDYAAELGGVIRDAATNGDIWYRSNGTGEYLSFAFEVTLPAGATINTASINFHCPIGSADEPNHTIDAEFTADAARPAAGDATNSLSGRTGTTATVNWYNANLGAPGYFDTPDLAAVFQELVNNFDYSAGATVLIRVYYAATGGDIGIATPAYTGNPVATLTVDYTSGGGTSHALSVSDIATGAPSIGTINAARNSASRALTTNDISTGAPTVDALIAARNSVSRALTINDVATGAPTIDALTAARGTGVHSLATNDIAAGAPTIDALVAARNSVSRALTTNDIAAGAPNIGTITAARGTGVHPLAISDISTGAPTVDALIAARVSVAHSIVLSDIATGAPSIDELVLAKYTDILSATIIVAVINTATFAVGNNDTTIVSNINDVTIAKG